MYFLAKNIRPCSKKNPIKSKLYKNGVLNWQYVAQTISHFVSHPEQIKQKLREKDAHMLCQFFDSQEYKKRVTDFLELQGQILTEDAISGVRPHVKYQHVLSCAQPFIKKPKILMTEPEVKERGKRRVKRSTIFEEVIKQKNHQAVDEERDVVPIEVKPKRIRQRSTIMPIFLRKIKARQMEVEDGQYEEKETEVAMTDLTDQTARKLINPHDVEPLYAQILHKCNAITDSITFRKISTKLQSTTEPYRLMEPAKAAEISPVIKQKTITFKPGNQPEKVSYQFPKNRTVLVPTRKASFVANGARVPPTTKLYPKKNMNLKNFDEFLCRETVKAKKAPKQTNKAPREEGVQIRMVKPKSSFELMHLKKAWSSDLEKKISVLRSLQHKEWKPIRDIVPSLYSKVKTGTAPVLLNPPKEKKKISYLERVMLRPKPTPDPPKKEPKRIEHESFTYKVVSKKRERWESKLREKFKINPPYWPHRLSLVGGSTMGLQLESGDELVVKNIAQNLHRPVPHFVEHADKPKPLHIDLHHGYHQYPSFSSVY